MAFNQTWNESEPTDTTEAKDIDNEIRKVKEALRERLAVEHAAYSDESSKEDVGEHRFVSSMGQLSERPDYGKTGRIFMATDKETLFLDTGTSWLPLNGYKVGDIYFTTIDEDPSAILGYGTWSRWGKGRVPVGYDPGDVDFDTIEETGGEKTHELTEAENGPHTHTGETNSNGAHNHSYNEPYWYDEIQPGADSEHGGRDYTGTTSTNGNHTHSFTTDVSGSGNPHNNLQPYITVFIWKRTA